MNNIQKTALALIAILAISANTSQAGDGTQAVVPPLPFGNLVTDDAALQAWWNGTNGLNHSQPQVTFDLVPLGDTAHKILQLFTNQFDLVMPADPDPNTINVKLELKNVNAIEIFNAMNIYFETGNIAAHWKLILNGSRPTAILEMKPPPVAAPPPAEPEKKHTVYSIAEILYMDNKPDKRADWITKSLSDVLDGIRKPDRSPANTPGGPEIKIHKEAGLLIFTGTAEETELVFHTLDALKQTETQDILHRGLPIEVPENLKK